MEKIKEKTLEVSRQTVQSLKALPRYAGQQFKELPDKSKALAISTVKGIKETQTRTRVKLIVAFIVIIACILIVGGIIGGKHIQYAKENRSGLDAEAQENTARALSVPRVESILACDSLNTGSVDCFKNNL